MLQEASVAGDSVGEAPGTMEGGCRGASSTMSCLPFGLPSKNLLADQKLQPASTETQPGS